MEGTSRLLEASPILLGLIPTFVSPVKHAPDTRIAGEWPQGRIPGVNCVPAPCPQEVQFSEHSTGVQGPYWVVKEDLVSPS